MLSINEDFQAGSVRVAAMVELIEEQFSCENCFPDMKIDAGTSLIG